MNLLGIDSDCGTAPQKTQIWARLATDWKLDLSELEEVLGLHDLSDAIDRILAGQMVGRGLVDLSL